MTIKIKQLLLIAITLSSFSVFSENKSSKAELRLPSFSIPQDMKIELWAGEQFTQNPGFFILIHMADC